MPARGGKLAAELVSKTPWSEARDVWLKLGLLSVCHRDLTRGELFVGCVFSACLLCAAPRCDWGWAPPCSCRWQGALFVVKSWWSFHMKNISLELLLALPLVLLLLLPSFVSFLSVSLCRCQRLQLQQWYRDRRSQSLGPSTPPPSTFFFLSCSLSYCFLPSSRSSIVSFYDQPFLFSAPPTLPSPPSLWLIDLSWVSGGKYKSSHCHFKQRDNQTLGCPLTTQGNWPWLWLLAPLSLSFFFLALFFPAPAFFSEISLSLSLSLPLSFLSSSQAHLLSLLPRPPPPPLLLRGRLG